MIENKEILITGGTGTLGKELTRQLRKLEPKGIRLFSRDEFKQFHFKKELEAAGIERVSFLIGDIRDEKRLTRAMDGVDWVFHTAAMKQIGSCNDNPIEAVKTNVEGTRNVVTACITSGVEKMMFVSTDKAVEPLNLYGASKMVGEKICIFSNVYNRTKFSCCRYGNVLGSRGSVIPLFKEQVKQYGKVFITSKEMSRFWIKIEEVARFLINRIMDMQGGEIFVPTMKKDLVINLANKLWPDIEYKITGIRHGEKTHEVLISDFECPYTKYENGYYTIYREPLYIRGNPFWSYCSGDNCNELTRDYLEEFLDDI